MANTFSTADAGPIVPVMFTPAAKGAQKRTTIFVVEDHALVATGLVELLNRSAEFSVVGTARDGFGAATPIAALRPDIVLLDLLMPGSGGSDEFRTAAARLGLVDTSETAGAFPLDAACA